MHKILIFSCLLLIAFCLRYENGPFHEATCTKSCPTNMQKQGDLCFSVCPTGWKDDGLFCRLTGYNRGPGYPWKYGDSLNDAGMISRCEKDYGKGNCEKRGAIYYPKCKFGYTAEGCCTCKPTPPHCEALNLGAPVDLSCAKKSFNPCS